MFDSEDSERMENEAESQRYISKFMLDQDQSYACTVLLVYNYYKYHVCYFLKYRDENYFCLLRY